MIDTHRIEEFESKSPLISGLGIMFITLSLFVSNIKAKKPIPNLIISTIVYFLASFIPFLKLLDSDNHIITMFSRLGPSFTIVGNSLILENIFDDLLKLLSEDDKAVEPSTYDYIIILFQSIGYMFYMISCIPPLLNVFMNPEFNIAGNTNLPSYDSNIGKMYAFSRFCIIICCFLIIINRMLLLINKNMRNKLLVRISRSFQIIMVGSFVISAIILSTATGLGPKKTTKYMA